MVPGAVQQYIQGDQGGRGTKLHIAMYSMNKYCLCIISCVLWIKNVVGRVEDGGKNFISYLFFQRKYHYYFILE